MGSRDADRLATHDELDSTVLLSTLCRAIRRNRPGFPERRHVHRVGRNLLLHEIREDLLRPAFRESLIPLVVADVIGVPLDRDVKISLGGENARDAGEPFASDVGETGAPRHEQHVWHHHDQAACRFACLEKHIQLFTQLLSQPPIPINQAKAGLKFSPAIEGVVMRGLSKEPVKRYADVIAFAQEFCDASQQPAEQEKTGFGAKFASMFRKKT